MGWRREEKVGKDTVLFILHATLNKKEATDLFLKT
jgi:hypothetical protein